MKYLRLLLFIERQYDISHARINRGFAFDVISMSRTVEPCRQYYKDYA